MAVRIRTSRPNNLEQYLVSQLNQPFRLKYRNSNAVIKTINRRGILGKLLRNALDLIADVDLPLDVQICYLIDDQINELRDVIQPDCLVRYQIAN